MITHSENGVRSVPRRGAGRRQMSWDVFRKQSPHHRRDAQESRGDEGRLNLEVGGMTLSSTGGHTDTLQLLDNVQE